MLVEKRNTNLYQYFDSMKDLKNYIDKNSTNLSRMSEYYKDGYIKESMYFNKVDENLLNEYKKASSKDVKLNQLVNKVKITYKNDVFGIVPNIPNTLMNLPCNMINLERRYIKTQSKILNILLNINIDRRWKQSQITERLVRMLKLVDNLELSGYRVNLYLGTCSFKSGRSATEYSKYTQYTIIKVKDSRDMLDVTKLIFPIINREFVRHVITYVCTLSDFEGWLFDSKSTNYLIENLKDLYNVKGDIFGVSFEYDTSDYKELERKVELYNESKR